MYFSCSSTAVETVSHDYLQQKLSLSLVEQLHSGPSAVPESSGVFSPLFVASCYKQCQVRPKTGFRGQSQQPDEGVKSEEVPGRSVLLALGDITEGK